MKKYLISIFLLIFTYSYGDIKDYGSHGEKYKIIEVDILAHINKKIASLDVSEYFKKHRDEIFKRATTGKLSLPKSKKDSTRYFDRKHVLEHEIFSINSKGEKKVIYPKGFEYNPLDYINSNEKFIVLDGSSPSEIAWFKKYEKSNKEQIVIVMLTEGNAVDVSNDLKMPVYLLSEIVAETLDVTCTPSVIYQEKNRLRIDEYGVHK